MAPAIIHRKIFQHHKDYTKCYRKLLCLGRFSFLCYINKSLMALVRFDFHCHARSGRLNIYIHETPQTQEATLSKNNKYTRIPNFYRWKVSWKLFQQIIVCAYCSHHKPRNLPILYNPKSIICCAKNLLISDRSCKSKCLLHFNRFIHRKSDL